MALIHEAAIIAIDEKKEYLSWSSFEKALEKIKPQITSEVLAFYDAFKAGENYN